MSTAVYRENEQLIEDTGRWLSRAGLLYLGLPVLIFATHWLNTGAAAFFVGLILFGFWKTWTSQKQVMLTPLTTVTRAIFRNHSIVFLLFFVWLAFSGTGGVGFQNTDYAASNALLKDLIENPWPLQLRDGVPLVYYLSYYLPAALVGKLVGWELANVFLFAWTWLGLILFWSVFSLALNLISFGILKQIIAAVLFILFGGWDFFGALTAYSPDILQPGVHIEWWAGIGQYSSNTTLLFWVPQHVLAPWLATAFLLLALLRNFEKESILFVSAFAFLWSPMASLGLLPFLFLLFAFTLSEKNLGSLFSVENVFVAPMIAALGLFFYSSNSFRFPLEWQITQEGYFGKYILFLVLECLPLTIPFLFQHMKQKVFLNEITLPPPVQLHDKERALGWTAVGILLILPVYKMGIMNDLCMRASIPALLVLATFFLKVLRQEFTFQYLQYAAVGLCVILGSGSAISEISRSVQNLSFRIPHREQVSSLLNSPDNSVVEQRAGDASAFFWHWLGPIRNKRNPTLEK